MINPIEAETVRHIYQRYTELGSVRALKDDLDHDGIVSKVRIGKLGSLAGGKSLARGALYLMLQNRIYRGEIVHKDKSYPGEHDAIIDEDLWNEVQNKLATNRNDRANGKNTHSPSLLAGLIYDDKGGRMTPSHANKNGTRYRYYISNTLITGNQRSAPGARRVPAADVEALAENRLCRFLEDKAELFNAVGSFITDINECSDIFTRSTELARLWSAATQPEKRNILRSLVDQIVLKKEWLEITINPGKLPTFLYEKEEHKYTASGPIPEVTPVVLNIPAKFKRAGIETRLVIESPGSNNRKKPDRSMHRLLGQAHRFRELIINNRGRTIAEFAKEAGVGDSYFSRILRLSFLAPDIVKTILNNDHPVDLTARRLSRDTHLPITWNEQHNWLSSK